MKNRLTLADACKMTTVELAKLDIDQLALLLEDVAELKAEAKRSDEAVYSAIHLKYNEEATSKRREKGIDTGSVRIDDGAFTIIADLPKRVEWDQSGLGQVEVALSEMGEPVEEYIKLKRDVSENAYKGWPSSLKKLFDPHRTVGAGKPTYKVSARGE